MTRVLLAGCSGVGATTVGALVAQRLGWPFLDDGALLARTAGGDAASLHARGGTDGLRAAQASALTLLLAVPGPLVATVPAGLLLDPVLQPRLRAGGHLVWLRAPASALVTRVGRGTGRPWLGEDPASSLPELVRATDPVGAAAAHQVVDASGAPGQVARAVVAGFPRGVLPDRRTSPR